MKTTPAGLTRYEKMALAKALRDFEKGRALLLAGLRSAEGHVGTQAATRGIEKSLDVINTLWTSIELQAKKLTET